jgi:hypothetical protein
MDNSPYEGIHLSLEVLVATIHVVITIHGNLFTNNAFTDIVSQLRNLQILFETYHLHMVTHNTSFGTDLPS